MSEYATYDERKLLQVIAEALAGGGIAVTIDPGDVEIGAVEIKNGTDDTRATVSASEPAANANGLVVRPVGQTALFGAVTETAPASDTASSGLNGRLQRIAQNITTLIGRFAAAVALADATANPTVTSVGAELMAYNGTTWDRVRAGVVGVQTTFTGLLNTITILRYNVTPPTLADGNIVGLQGDANGYLKGREQYAPAAEDNTNGVIAIANKPLAVPTYAPTSATSTANEASRVAKASAGILYRINGYNAKASAQFIQLHNTASLPADTAVPVLPFTVPASSNFSIDFGMMGRYFSTGITVCNSSTEATKTIGASDTWFDILYA